MSSANDFKSKICYERQEGDKTNYPLELTILNGEKLSDSVNLFGTSLVGIYLPANIIGTNLYFYLWDGANFKLATIASPLTSDDMMINIKADRVYPFVPADFAAFKFMKVETDIVQTSDVTIKLITRALA